MPVVRDLGAIGGAEQKARTEHAARVRRGIAWSLREQPGHLIAAAFHVTGRARDPVVLRDRVLVAVRRIKQMLTEPHLCGHRIRGHARDRRALDGEADAISVSRELHDGDIARVAFVEVRDAVIRRDRDALGHVTGQGPRERRFDARTRDCEEIFAVGIDDQRERAIVGELDRVRARDHVAERAIDPWHILRVGRQRRGERTTGHDRDRGNAVRSKSKVGCALSVPSNSWTSHMSCVPGRAARS